MVRLMVETWLGRQAERTWFSAELGRFLAWCRKQDLVERNICDDSTATRSHKARRHAITFRRSMSSAPYGAPIEDQRQRDLIRFLLLLPLRREEAAGLVGAKLTCSCGASVSQQPA